MKTSLKIRILLSYMAIIVLLTVVFILVTNQIINRRFNILTNQVGERNAQWAAEALADYYRVNDSWEGLNGILDQSRTPAGMMNRMSPSLRMFRRNWLDGERGEGLIILDEKGEVLGYNTRDETIARILGDRKDRGVPVIVDGEVVGRVISASALGVLNTFQNVFLLNVNRQMILAAVLAGAAVLLFASIQTQAIIKPVKQLAQAARRIASGDFSQRIEVSSGDELGEMADSFNSMAAELEKQQMLRKRATADIAHELRTPLSVLQIDLESMEDGIIAPSPESIARLKTEVLHLNRLVENLRMLSLAESGELQMDMETLQMDEILKSTVDRLYLNAAQKGVRLSVEVPREKVFVRGSEQHLSQIVLNLLSNALSYTDAGGDVSVRLDIQEKQALVSVLDTGAGIPAEELNNVFERLYRVAPARSRDKGGSGLGLAITRSLVELHGGRIWAESSPGAGSAFKFSLPLVEPPQA